VTVIKAFQITSYASVNAQCYKSKPRQNQQYHQALRDNKDDV